MKLADLILLLSTDVDGTAILSEGGERVERILNAEEIGRRLRELRGVSRTLADVSAGSGVSVQAVCQYENGQRIPSAETVAKLAQYYDTTVDHIFFGP